MPILTVNVIEQDIDRATPCDSWACPIAQALWRITGVRWLVGRRYCALLGQVTSEVLLPAEACRWISDYDGTKLGKPFTFQLEIPS